MTTANSQLVPDYRSTAPTASGLRAVLIQTGAMFVDAYRELHSKKLFWITLVLSLLVVVSFAFVSINDKGLVTYDRKTKKDAFYYYKAQWSEEKFIYITSRRWTERTEDTTDIKVYSNLPTVGLFVNGEWQGSLSADNHVFVWKDIKLAPGDNVIEALPVDNTAVSRDSVHWNLQVAPEPPPEVPPDPPPTDLPGDPPVVQFSVWKEIDHGQGEEE